MFNRPEENKWKYNNTLIKIKEESNRKLATGWANRWDDIDAYDAEKVLDDAPELDGFYILQCIPLNKYPSTYKFFEKLLTEKIQGNEVSKSEYLELQDRAVEEYPDEKNRNEYREALNQAIQGLFLILKYLYSGRKKYFVKDILKPLEEDGVSYENPRSIYIEYAALENEAEIEDLYWELDLPEFGYFDPEEEIVFFARGNKEDLDRETYLDSYDWDTYYDSY